MKPSFVYLCVAAHLLILSGIPAYAQQGAQPPAVLVQPAELRSMTKQAEYVGRAEALEKVDLRARVTGFLGPRLFKEGDDVKEAQVVFTIERAAVSPGNLVGPDSGVLATVVQDNPMQVLFSVTQREMLEAKDSEVTGKVRARVRLANGSLYSEKGRIDFLDIQVNPRTDGQ